MREADKDAGIFFSIHWLTTNDPLVYLRRLRCRSRNYEAYNGVISFINSNGKLEFQEYTTSQSGHLNLRIILRTT